MVRQSGITVLCSVAFLSFAASLFLILNTVAVAREEKRQEVAPVYGYEVITVYDHDPKSFTQGLCFAEGMLYEGTGLYGFSTLRRKHLESDTVEARSLPKDLYGEGVTVYEDQVIQLTWKSGTGIVWAKKDLHFKRTFHYSTEGWGITHDNERLIMSDGSDTLYFLDPGSFEIKRRLTVTDRNTFVSRLNELEYINGEIWANIWKENRIARIDPASGKVTGWVDLSGLVALAEPEPGGDNVLNGIAYDSDRDRIFVTGKRWKKLFEIKVKRKDLPQ